MTVMTVSVLQSLGKPRSLSNSYRKNVRFASVVSEIPIPTPLSMVAEADAENDQSDPPSSSTASSSLEPGPDLAGRLISFKRVSDG